MHINNPERYVANVTSDALRNGQRVVRAMRHLDQVARFFPLSTAGGTLASSLHHRTRLEMRAELGDVVAALAWAYDTMAILDGDVEGAISEPPRSTR